MSYPKFFDKVEPIVVFDPLSKVLGSIEEGLYEFSYLEIVKAAGHSCPTVSGAYLMTQCALRELYKEEPAMRGEIEVLFKDLLEDGVAGVIGNVVTHITGATQKSGFKGLNSKFARHSLMKFDADITASARFIRLDTKESVDVVYDPSSILPNPDMQILMKKMMTGEATEDELKEFGVLWQDRVKRIFENSKKVVKLV